MKRRPPMTKPVYALDEWNLGTDKLSIWVEGERIFPVEPEQFGDIYQKNLIDVILYAVNNIYQVEQTSGQQASRIKTLEAEKKELLETLEEYGDHKHNCRLNAPPDLPYQNVCSCGLDQAIAKAKGG
jgi:hypothetical protein